jgi:hypothetical protein
MVPPRVLMINCSGIERHGSLTEPLANSSVDEVTTPEAVAEVKVPLTPSVRLVSSLPAGDEGFDGLIVMGGPFSVRTESSQEGEVSQPSCWLSAASHRQWPDCQHYRPVPPEPASATHDCTLPSFCCQGPHSRTHSHAGGARCRAPHLMTSSRAAKTSSAPSPQRASLCLASA